MKYIFVYVSAATGDYTNKAKWCNENGCYIEEIEPLKNGTRQFQIKQREKIEPQIKTKSTHTLENAEKKIEDLQAEISRLTARIEELEKEQEAGK